MKKHFKEQRRRIDRLIRDTKNDLYDYIKKAKSFSPRQEHEQYVYTLIYNMCQNHYDFLMRKYNMYQDRNFPKVDEFLYTKDGSKLIDRIKRWFDEFNHTRNKTLLFYRTGLIAKHQGHYLDAEMTLKIVRETNTYKYCTISEGGVDGSCEEECIDHHGTYLITETFELPPYHPDCNCVYWFHNNPNPRNEPDDEEDYYPEQEGWLPIDLPPQELEKEKKKVRLRRKKE